MSERPSPKNELQTPFKTFIKVRHDPMFYGEVLGDHINASLSSRSAYRRHVHKKLEELPKMHNKALTRLGIEIEVENIGGNIGKWKGPPWTVKADGSLRNGGVEFVTAAIRPEDVPISLALLYAWFENSKLEPDFSWRTSTHVHVEVRSWTAEQFKNFLLLYLVFEEALFNFANEDRKQNNIFCTPLTKTDIGLFVELFRAKTQRQILDALTSMFRHHQKYSALNLNPLFEFGTIEFRHLGGEREAGKVITWVDILLKLFEYSTKVESELLKFQIETLNTNSEYRTLADTVFSIELSRHLQIDNTGGCCLAQGVTICKELLSLPIELEKNRTEKSGLELFFDSPLMPEETQSKKLIVGGRFLVPEPFDHAGAEELARSLHIAGFTRLFSEFRAPQPITSWNPAGLTKAEWVISRGVPERPETSEENRHQLAQRNLFDYLRTNFA